MKCHELLDQRSLALHRVIVARLRANPALIKTAKSNLERWLRTCSEGVRPSLEKWQIVLDGEFEDVLRILESLDENGQQFRQNSPFCGLLTNAERTEIFLQFRR